MSHADELIANPPGRPGRHRLKVSHEIIRSLIADIASGRIARGSRLPSERDLAFEFRVSQPTMREAIRALDVMGLVDVRHGSGVFVAADMTNFVSNTLQTLLHVERVGILETLEVRAALGGYSAVRACALATDAQLSMLRDAVSQCERATESGDVLDMARSVVDFQNLFSAAAHNPLLFSVETFLVRTLMQLQLQAKLHAGLEYWQHQTRMFSEDRTKLVDLLDSRDAEGTLVAMNVYLDDQRRHFESDADLRGITISTAAMGEHDLL